VRNKPNWPVGKMEAKCLYCNGLEEKVRAERQWKTKPIGEKCEV
jgi:hypothetical protein